ncbi:diguanylate cyclase [Magnetospira sp. QH-2]|uniref:diguanylate cyclase n=1 Tax=Magnetospira sp. (strain QH-2) TaxID=1288970 RepID=UPI0003E80D1B|nr:diguanylate cyclase [Magnetospira sp. QH-2]CCQ72481.1 putative diguanylate cyclase (GGDEF)domain [Magnetospira sp. QH-2]
MSPSDDFNQVAETAWAAVEHMAKLKVEPSPNNFSVWYHYHVGDMPDLRRTLDILLDNNQDFTPDRNADIHRKFFTTDEERASVRSASDELEAQISKVLTYMAEMGGSAKDYGETLQSHSEQISQAGGPDDLGSAITSILEATREMEAQNEALEKQLAASGQQVDQLRTDLDKMRHEALTDGLTGIPNRKVFDAALRTAATEAMEEGGELTLLMIDIDHFKRFNDTYGHQIGDQVLKVLAQVLTSSIKGQDTAARYGGEEFGIILPATSLIGAKKVGEAVCDKIRNKSLVNRKTGKKMGRLSVSIGVSLFQYGEPLGQLVERADACLYAAKGRGRDMVIGEDELSPDELQVAK